MAEQPTVQGRQNALHTSDTASTNQRKYSKYGKFHIFNHIALAQALITLLVHIYKYTT